LIKDNKGNLLDTLVAKNVTEQNEMEKVIILIKDIENENKGLVKSFQKDSANLNKLFNELTQYWK
jgi:ribosomal protein L17